MEDKRLDTKHGLKHDFCRHAYWVARRDNKYISGWHFKISFLQRTTHNRNHILYWVGIRSFLLWWKSNRLLLLYDKKGIRCCWLKQNDWLWTWSIRLSMPYQTRKLDFTLWPKMQTLVLDSMAFTRWCNFSYLPISWLYFALDHSFKNYKDK